VPELPEIQALVDGMRAAVVGRRVVAANAWQPSTVKTAKPGLGDLVGRELREVWRRGKLIGLDVNGISVVIHLMQGGRLGLTPTATKRPGRQVAVSIALEGGDEIRLREAATEHRASVHLMATAAVAEHPQVAGLGPEPIGLPPDAWRARLTARPARLYTAIRDGHRIAGIGRAYASDIMWAARLAPFARTDRLTDDEYDRLARAADVVLTQALDRARERITTTMPDREERVTAVHRHYGDPCLRCGRRLERVSFEGYELVYCPDCQNGGRVYADRRMSRLLK
jgi:formamidopyrimidine-DNA glycosylase